MTISFLPQRACSVIPLGLEPAPFVSDRQHFQGRKAASARGSTYQLLTGPLIHLKNESSSCGRNREMDYALRILGFS